MSTTLSIDVETGKETSSIYAGTPFSCLDRKIKHYNIVLEKKVCLIGRGCMSQQSYVQLLFNETLLNIADYYSIIVYKLINGFSSTNGI